MYTRRVVWRNWTVVTVRERHLSSDQRWIFLKTRCSVFGCKFENWTECVQGKREQGDVLPEDYQVLSSNTRCVCCQGRMDVYRSGWGLRWDLGTSYSLSMRERGGSFAEVFLIKCPTVYYNIDGISGFSFLRYTSWGRTFPET